MGEIGGYLELVANNGTEYHSDLMRFNTARNCILFCTLTRKYSKVYIPFYLCNSISKLFDDNKISYEYFEISEDFKPVETFKVKSDECLLLVNYYGQLTNEDIREYKDKFNIIVDNTQSFFQYPVKNVDTVYSCRKYFGVADGAYLNIQDDNSNIKYNRLEIDLSFNRMTHILGRFETTASEHFSSFRGNEELLADLPIRKMSRLTQNILNGLNYNEIKRKRIMNYKVLESKLGKINQLKPLNFAGLFMYPLLLENGYKLKDELIKEKIYVPTLWDNVLAITNKESISHEYAKNIIPLPIDQRYNENDMLRIIECIGLILRIEF